MAEVVYHLVPTSNHNRWANYILRPMLFIILFLHQTTTRKEKRMAEKCCLSSCSYIKPQLPYLCPRLIQRCLSSCSYIKPQRTFAQVRRQRVVYHLVPTSNHNGGWHHPPKPQLFIILFLHQTTTRDTFHCSFA